MPNRKKFHLKIPFWSIISPFATIGFILGTSALVIAYGRGYRFRPSSEQMVNSTGLLSANSDPSAAQIFVDGELKNATNTSFSVDPGEHTIKIVKDGYLAWQKNIFIEKEVVSRADAFLFPLSPSLSSLTTTGITKPNLSPDGTKIVYIVPSNNAKLKADDPGGIWMYEVVDRTLGFNRDPKKIAAIDPAFDLDKGVLRWSPDSTELLIDTPTQARLYKIANRTPEMQIVTDTLGTILDTWADEEIVKHTKQLSSFKQPIIDIATSSAKIISFSPDETKILYEATASATLPIVMDPPLIGSNSTTEVRKIVPGSIYVYDSKEDKNYFLLVMSEVIPSPTPTPTPTSKGKAVKSTFPTPSTLASTPFPLRWFPTNRHLILTKDGKIDILEYDRTNWVTVYSGPFFENFAAPWPGGSRIVILTNLNPGGSPLPNLYTVNLR